ncbi:MAG: hypothetical protein HY558_03890 [Euryarchaeota archaeon]|nr:hypothetical protein [Euryarchaeota archaeon]
MTPDDHCEMCGSTVDLREATFYQWDATYQLQRPRRATVCRECAEGMSIETRERGVL